MTRTLTCIAIALAALVAAPAPAAAEDPPPTKEQLAAAKKAFEEGNALYKSGKLLDAVEKLKESYRLSRNAFLLYNIGHTYDQLNQKDQVLFYFKKFLEAAPANAPMRPEVVKRVAALEQEKQAAGGTAPPVKPDEPEPPPATPGGKYTAADFKHTPVVTAKPGTAFDVTATVPSDSGWKVTLYYRGSGSAEFTKEEMTARGSELVGAIPGEKIAGYWIQYYLEVRDDAGTLVTRSGKSTSPNLVNIEGGPTEEDPFFVKNRTRTDPNQSDTSRSRFSKVTWISTGATMVILGSSLTFFFLAKDHHDALVTDANSCGTPPCQPFDAEYAQKIEERGLRYDTMYKVTFGLGLAGAAVAGFFWYRDLTRKRPESSVAVTPAIGDGFAGAAVGRRF